MAGNDAGTAGALGSIGSLLGGAAAPATGGMSLLLPLLMSFGPGIISHLFGGRSPADQYKDEVAKLMDPALQGALRKQFFNANVNSPGFSAGQGAIAAGANQTANQIAEKLGSHGITGSGTSAILNSAGPSLVGSEMARLYMGADQSAQQSVSDYINARLAALKGTNFSTMTTNQNNPDMNYYGAGWSNFAPYLTNYLKTNYPHLFTGAAPASSAPTPTLSGPQTSQASQNLSSLSGMTPASMSMMQPGSSDTGQLGSQQRQWLPPAVKVPSQGRA